MSSGIRDRVGLGVAFVDAALRYWLTVWPRVGRGVGYWRRRAAGIRDPELRQIALDSLSKRSNIEGAAVFAAFAPRAHRAAVVRALVAFQAAYSYADMLSEQPHVRAIENGQRLHEALLVALDLKEAHHDYYAHHPQHDDDGYLQGLTDACRAALATLPSYPAVAARALVAAERIVTFQSLNVGKAQGDHEELERWARAQTPAGAELQWWETAAAGGSSLGVYVLIAAAAERQLRQADVVAMEEAYFPWIEALHSLLDNLVDRGEDARTDQRNLLDYYSSPAQAATRLRVLAVRAMSSAWALPRGRRHALIVAAMAGNYLSSAEAQTPEVAALSRGVLGALGELARPTLLVFKLRRLVV